MANNKPGKNHERLKEKVMLVAAKSFLEVGYSNTTLKMICAGAGLSNGSVMNLFGSKEGILCGLVELVIDAQFKETENILKDITDDKLLTYAAETVLQLHIVEMNENLREIYCNAYSLPKPSAVLQQTITGKLEEIFKEQLPELETKDFYMLEIATGGIMRGFMTIPCNMWFTLEMKVEAFLKNTLRLYYVPDERIREAIHFVKGIDFKKAAKETVDGIFQYLEKQRESLEI
ncbi:MAG: TetR/AcrR family transcriptional regulator [Clostridiales bacterium]|nr:TetR/AcrR family transcriptional regulator [Clostridiales bacterium]